MLGILVLRYVYLDMWNKTRCLDMCTVLGIVVLRYVYCAVHTGTYICRLGWAYWCSKGMDTVLGILVLRIVYCTVHSH